MQDMFVALNCFNTILLFTKEEVGLFKTIKLIYMLRRYIVGQTFIQYIVFNALASLASRQTIINMTSDFRGWIWDNLADLIILPLVFFFMLTYMGQHLKYEMVVDYRQKVKTEYLYYQSVFFGTVLLILLYIGKYSYIHFTGKTITVFELVLSSVFVAMPVFWTRVFINFALSFFGVLLYYWITYGEYQKMDKEYRKGKLSPFDFYLRIRYLQIIRESLAPNGITLGITEEDTSSVVDTIEKSVNTNGHTEEFVSLVREESDKAKQRSYRYRFALVAFLVASSLYYTVTTTWTIYKSEKNFANIKISEPVQEQNWVDWREDQFCFYDASNLALDSDNTVMTTLLRFKSGDNQDWYYNRLYIKYPEGNMLFIATTEKGITTGISKGKGKILEKGESYDKELYYYFLNKLELQRAQKSKLKIDLSEYHNRLSENKSVANMGFEYEYNSRKYIIGDGTGEINYLGKNTTAALMDNVTIGCYEADGTKLVKSVDIPKGMALTKRLGKIQNNRITNYGTTAILTRNLTAGDVSGNPEDYLSKKGEVILKKGETLIVGKKTLDSKYQCHFDCNGKKYDINLSDANFSPSYNHYWYLFAIPTENGKESYWIEGKYLVPVTVK